MVEKACEAAFSPPLKSRDEILLAGWRSLPKGEAGFITGFITGSTE